MSGHSKWSTIKRQKAVTDARRSAVFTKYGRLISVAARQGGADPATNFRLRLAIDKAKAANLPNSNIDRAIQAGSGAGNEGQSKDVVYEGFGPGGAAVMVEAITDNPNRTASEVRQTFTKHGGSMGGQNSVGWMFTSKGVITLPTLSVTADRDQFQLDAIDAGAEDVRMDDDHITIIAAPDHVQAMKDWLSDRKLDQATVELTLVPTSTTTLSPADQDKHYGLMSALDDLDDVTNVISNDV